MIKTENLGDDVIGIILDRPNSSHNFQDEKAIYGLGWTHNFHSPNPGIWTEGNISTLLFKF